MTQRFERVAPGPPQHSVHSHSSVDYRRMFLGTARSLLKLADLSSTHPSIDISSPST